MESTFRPALKLMIGRSLGFLGLFFVPIVLVRLLEPSEFGTYKQVFLILTTLYLIMQAGMAESLYYFIPRESGKAGQFIANSVLCLGVMAVAATLLVYFSRSYIAGWMGNPELARHLPWVSAILGLTLLSAAFETILVSGKRVTLAATVYGLSDLLRAGLFIVPVMIWRDLEPLLIGGVVFGSIRLVSMSIYLLKRFRHSIAVDLHQMWRQLGYAVPFGLAALVEVVQANYHQYAVSFQVDAAVFAIYAVGCLQVPLVDLLASPTANVMMVRMSDWIDRDRSMVQRLWRDATRKLMLIFLPLAVFVIAEASEIIVLLFTSAYRASVPIFMIWSLTIPLAALPTDGVLRVFATTRFLLVNNVFRLVIVAVLIGPAIRIFGLPGAAMATVLALAVSKAAALIRMRPLLDVPMGEVLAWRECLPILSAATVAVLPGTLIGAGAGLPQFAGIVLAGVLYFGTYVLLLAAFGLLNPVEREEIRNIIGRWREAAVEMD